MDFLSPNFSHVSSIPLTVYSFLLRLSRWLIPGFDERSSSRNGLRVCALDRLIVLLVVALANDEIDRRVIAHWASNDGRHCRCWLVHGLFKGDREFDRSSAKEIAIAHQEHQATGH